MDARTWNPLRSGLRRQKCVLLGLGGVGRALLNEILAARRLHADRFGLRWQIAGLLDSRGALLAEELDDAALTAASSAKQKGASLLELEGSSPIHMAAMPESEGLIVADCTATEAVTPLLLATVVAGGGVALANKKPLTASWEDFEALASRPARVRWESTVGSGLPVNATLARIVSSGDSVTKIAGTFSGTLGFLMTGLEKGRAFSDLVIEAHSRGYTEPDPRDDLGGLDVARKALILARTIGWRLEMSDVDVEGLYPAGELERLDVEGFLKRIPDLDEYFRQRVEAAAATGRSLRYAARIEDGRCFVGPVEVQRDTPLGRLQGNDNLIEFTTGFFQPNPLVIQGRGAGVGATAAGVLADMMELALAMEKPR